MQLSSVLKGVEQTKQCCDFSLEITGVSFNSKQVKRGDVFVCLKGKTNGNNYVQEAILNGAVCIVSEDNLNVELPCVVVKNSRIALSQICKNFYNSAVDSLKVIMVTGTNGKTTTSYLIYNILKHNNINCALFGTNGIFYDNKQLYYGLTTPDPTDLHFWFEQLKNLNVTHVVMEVSAHAIKLNKLYGIKAEQIIFTNLTEEHLDYFLTMEQYANTKLNFINSANTKLAITNVDDSYGIKLLKGDVQTISYGLSFPSDTFALNISNSISGLNFYVNVMDEIIQIKSSLSGLYNVYNLMAAITSAHCLGVTVNNIKTAIEKTKLIPGRFNKFYLDLNKLVVVDFAHTPDGFEKVLSELKQFRSGKIIVVFGCVGYSDTEKRINMGRVASKYSNEIVLTTDNPNFTNFTDICDDVVKGVSVPYKLEFDRKVAVRNSFMNLKENETLVLLGKGCETTNLINGELIAYSDLDEVENCIKEFYSVKKGDRIDENII